MSCLHWGSIGQPPLLSHLSSGEVYSPDLDRLHLLYTRAAAMSAGTLGAEQK